MVGEGINKEEKGQVESGSRNIIEFLYPHTKLEAHGDMDSLTKWGRQMKDSLVNSSSRRDEEQVLKQQLDEMKRKLDVHKDCNLLLNDELPIIWSEMQKILRPDKADVAEDLLFDNQMERMLTAGSIVLKTVDETANKFKDQINGADNTDQQSMSKASLRMLETIASSNYLGVALSVVAVAMKSYRACANNTAQCVDLMTTMADFLAQVRIVWDSTQYRKNERESFKEVTHILIMCALKIHAMSTSSGPIRFIFSFINQQDLNVIDKKISSLYTKLNLQVSVSTFRDLNQTKYSNVIPSNPKTVGIETITKDVVEKLGVGQQTMQGMKRCVCLDAMGGAGKSTIADSAYLRLIQMHKLKGYNHCRLELEFSEKTENTERQKELLEKLTERKSPEIGNTQEGTSRMNTEIKNLERPVFLLLDNILRAADLPSLVPQANSCFPGSAILVTTTNHGKLLNGLKNLGWDVVIIPIPPLDDESARTLLYWSMGCEQAAVDITVRSEWEEKLLIACGRLPLALKVAGGHIQDFGNNEKKSWEFAVKSLTDGTPMTGDESDNQLSRLRFSIDCLSPILKEAFFDVLSFYDGQEWSLDFQSVVGMVELKMLETRHLIERKTESSFIGWIYDPLLQTSTKTKTIVHIHDVLKGLGRRIMEEMGNNRITSTDELSSSLATHDTRCKIKGIWLKQEDAVLDAKHLLDMPNIRFLVNVKVEDESKSRPALKSLRKCHISCLPFPLSKADDLKSLQFSNIAIEMTQEQATKSLTFLSLVESDYLQWFKNSRLESLELSNCFKLEILEGFESLSSLKHLNITACPILKRVCIEGCNLQSLCILFCKALETMKLQSNISNYTSNMRCLIIKNCPKLGELPSSDYSSLHHLQVEGCKAITELPQQLTNRPNLKYASLKNCSNLAQIPDSFLDVIPNLEELSLDGCSSLATLGASPQYKSSSSSLEFISLSNCSNLSQLPNDLLTAIPKLKYLRLDGCSSLSEIPVVSACSNLETLTLHGCLKLAKLPDGFLTDCPNLIYLSFPLPDPPKDLLISCNNNLTSLTLDRCSKLPDNFLSSCPNLEKLSIATSLELSELPNSFLTKCTNLKTLSLYRCPKLLELPNDFLTSCTKLTHISLGKCYKLKELPIGFLCSEFPNLKSLDLTECSQLSHLPNGFLKDCPNLEELILDGCSNLSSLADDFLANCTKLIHLRMYRCSELSELPVGFLHACTKLNSLRLNSCLKLLNLPNDFLNACTNLNYLCLDECSKLLELPNDFLKVCPSLTRLSLNGCSNLAKLPDGFLISSPKLQYLSLEKCSKLQIPDGFANSFKDVENFVFINV